MNKKIDPEKFKKLIQELSEKILLVEGKKDEEALKRLGLKNIIAINGKPLYIVAEELSAKNQEIVILSDFDKAGKEINLKLKKLLQRYKKTTNVRLRKGIMNLGKNKIEDLGNLANSQELEYPAFKEDDNHVKISTNFNKIRNKSTDRCEGSNRET
ncbi:MAG: toprim domain-containing protein [Candidatus Aenigmarchaeota archaeon]|nr:toprim domain-containing protein [Candidatus Aenigmarchaeota archaeon]